MNAEHAATKMKYRTNRCNLSDGADIESKDFATKANAIKWGRRCAHFWVRRIETRELVARAAIAKAKGGAS